MQFGAIIVQTGSKNGHFVASQRFRQAGSLAEGRLLGAAPMRFGYPEGRGFRLAPWLHGAMPQVPLGEAYAMRFAGGDSPLPMLRAKDFLLAGLALSTGALALVVWRQQKEMERLTSVAQRAVAMVPSADTMTLRLAANRTFSVASGTRPGDPRAPDGTLRDEPPRQPESPRLSRKRAGAISKLMDNPEFIRALNLQRQSLLDARFSDLFRRLGLDDEALAEFKRLLVEKENVALDVVAVSETAADGPLKPETLGASIRAAQSQIEQAIESSLGGDRYAMYREYERTLAHRTTVAQLERRLSYTGAPLQPAQAEAIVRIMESHTPPAVEQGAQPLSVLVRSGVPEAVPVVPASAGAGRVTNDVVAQAQTILTPSQVDALKQIQLEQEAAMRAAQIIREVAPAAVSDMLPTVPAVWLN